MREIKKIHIYIEGTDRVKTCFTEGNRLVFETDRSVRDTYNEALAFEMGFSFGHDKSNFTMETIHMTQEEFDALKLEENPWGGMGPRTKKKKK